MKFLLSIRSLVFLLVALLCITETHAQLKFDGDFRLRWYSDAYTQAIDGRGKENYIRMFGRLHLSARASDMVNFNTELASNKYNNKTIFLDQYIDDRFDSLEPIK